ncbi:MAG: hypothetical protein M9962_08595 [Oligoflexia bacterium]|nr:hypothetical protein [Oligoflexia bacterium]
MKTIMFALLAVLTSGSFAVANDFNPGAGQGYTQDQLRRNPHHRPHRPAPPQHPNYPVPPQYPQYPNYPQYPQYPGYNTYGNVCRNGAYWCSMNYPTPVGTPCACVFPNWYFQGVVTNW